MTGGAAADRTESVARRIVTTRSGGVSAEPFDSFNLGGGVGDDPSAVEANRARLAAAAGLSTGHIVWMQQVHGTRVVPVDGPGPLPGTDGIVTTRRDLALAVLVADCVPILAVDGTAGVIGAAHAGRRGAADGIGPELLAAMTEAGADPAGVQVLLGPAICGRCYEVPAQMQAQVEATLPGSACETADGTSGLDLRAGLAAQFTSAGVPTVLIDQRCTREDPDLFSHRRSGRTGRQAGLIWLPGN